jgi:sec-independent protein translocase protein TatA
MFGIGAQELMLILVIVLVLFGGSKLPDLAKSLGRSMKEFKKGIGEPDEGSVAKAEPPPPAGAAPPTCRHCGHALDAAWTHCPHCGTAAAGHGPSGTV